MPRISIPEYETLQHATASCISSAQATQRLSPPPRRTRLLASGQWGLTALCALLLLTFFTALPAQSALIGLRQTGTGATEISASLGENISLDLFLDTGGLSFEGYAVGVDFVGGPVTAIAVSQQAIGLNPGIFGAPVINNAAGTIRNINQTTFTGGLAAGEYVIDTIQFTMGALAPGSELVITPGLFGEALGLGGGSCPGTTVGCSVSFSSFTVPEPSTGLLLATGLALLHGGSTRRRRRA